MILWCWAPPPFNVMWSIQSEKDQSEEKDQPQFMNKGPMEVCGSFVQPPNMAPVMDILDKWGMETPFAEDDVVGTSVLAVSTSVWGVGVCVRLCVGMCLCYTSGVVLNQVTTYIKAHCTCGYLAPPPHAHTHSRCSLLRWEFSTYPVRTNTRPCLNWTRRQWTKCGT